MYQRLICHQNASFHRNYRKHRFQYLIDSNDMVSLQREFPGKYTLLYGDKDPQEVQKQNLEEQERKKQKPTGNNKPVNLAELVR